MNLATFRDKWSSKQPKLMPSGQFWFLSGTACDFVTAPTSYRSACGIDYLVKNYLKWQAIQLTIPRLVYPLNNYRFME